MATIVNNKNRNGFSLIELMVAMVILTIATLGLLQALTHYIQINMDNEMRNEAMRITEKRMELIRGLQFADTPQDELIPDDGVTVFELSAGAQFPITETKTYSKIIYSLYCTDNHKPIVISFRRCYTEQQGDSGACYLDEQGYVTSA